MNSQVNHEVYQEPLSDLLLALEAAQSNAKISIQCAVGVGVIEVHKGCLVSSSLGDKTGETALSAQLELREGHYQLVPLCKEPTGALKNLGEMVQKILRNRPSGSRGGLNVGARLERTYSPLPGGLSPSELRVLSSINGSLTALGVIAREQGHPADLLQELRNLYSLGLIRPLRQSTLALGTRVAAGRDESSEGSSNEVSPGPTQISSERVKSSLIPVRLSSGALPPQGTRYSSVPPCSLAEEHVKLPRSMSGASLVLGGTATRSGKIAPRLGSTLPGLAPVDKSPVDKSPVVSKPVVSKPVFSLGSTLPSNGSVRAGATPSAEPVQEQETKLPLPLSPDITARSHWYKEATPDNETPEDAQGQLSESEMPVPSSRLGGDALRQLGELNEAITSSRAPRLPTIREDDLSQELSCPGSVPDPDLLPGSSKDQTSSLPRVGRYEVLSRLKRGGMGSVYLCRLTGSAGFRRLFAMKVLHGHLAKQDDTLNAFLHEARVLGALHHKNIVGVADVGTPKEPYIVLEYIEGGSLSELYRATTAGRNPRVIVAIVLDALDGLSAAHQARDASGKSLSLVHCDVTPHNLLVSVDGVCCLTDFGIARTGKLSVREEVTCGKPGYLAPERIRREYSDHRADIFSMGVVLYAGLAGVEPYFADSSDEMMLNILRGAPGVPSHGHFHPPAALDELCLKALAPDPDSRFQSASEMATELRRVAAEEDLLAPPAEVAEWVRLSLAPTIAARRAASLRGTETNESRFETSVIPPSYEEIGENSPHPASAAETTGPLEGPLSLGNQKDETEELALPTELPKRDPVDISVAYRAKKIAIYSALTAAMGLFVWVALKPNLISNYVRMGPPPVQGDDEQVTLQGAEAAQLAPSLRYKKEQPEVSKKSPSKKGDEVSSPEPRQKVLPQNSKNGRAVALPPIVPSGETR